MKLPNRSGVEHGILGQALHRLDRQWRTLLKIATRMGLAEKNKKEPATSEQRA